MKKPDSAVIRETRNIAVGVLALSTVLQLVFLLIGKWDKTVLFGNLFIGFAVILNFFLMGLSVQKAVALEPKESKKMVTTSMALRNMMMFAFLATAVLLPKAFNIWASLIPVTFPRIVIAIYPLFGKKTDSFAKGGED
ncbi:MAG: hypothetical protein IKI97_09335 [Clostridia bacterium]|nr:hypothetical protein [Clostridia bacterium]